MSLALEYREKIIFTKEPEKLEADLAALIAGAKEPEEFEALGELLVDLHSYLINWRLAPYVKEGKLAADAVEKAGAALENALADHADILAKAKETIDVVEKSQMRKLCQATTDGQSATYYGHDYASGLTEGLRKGARWVTSNPAKINLFRQDLPEQWTQLVKEAREENPGCTIDRLKSVLYCKVCAVSARELYPIFEATNQEFGVVFMQVDPKFIHDSNRMYSQVHEWFHEMRKELGGREPNVIIKLPAVNEAEPVAEKLVAEDIRICMTLDYTVYQHDRFAKIIEKGKRKGYLVLMCGFLDDNVAKELEAMGIEDPKKYSVHASEAVIRKSWAHLKEMGCTKSDIMTAAIRGDWTIKNSISDDPAHPVLITTVKGMVDLYDKEERDLTSVMTEPVPADILEVLEKSKIYREAIEFDGLNPDTLFDYVPLQAVLSGFCKAWDEVEQSLMAEA